MNEMEAEMEIDPDLFMICRLCVDSKGKFQIVPAVQKNIKDLFDIDIQPFDGLSQLICSACKINISEFSNVKNTYQRAQNSLLERARTVRLIALSGDSDGHDTDRLVTEAIPVPSPPPKTNKQNEVELADTNRCGENVINKLDANEKKNSEPTNFGSTASAEFDCHSSSSTTERISDNDIVEHGTSTNKRSLRLSRLTETHARNINCRLCKKECQNFYYLKKHMKTHRELVCQYKNILRYHCYVPLERLEKPLKEQNDTVKIEPSLILEEGANPKYFITYKNKLLEPDSPGVATHRRKRSSYTEYFNEADGEKQKKTSKKRYKRLRVSSDSEESTNDSPNDEILTTVKKAISLMTELIPAASTDAEKISSLSYNEVQERIPELNNNITVAEGSNKNILENHNSILLPTAQNHLTMLNRSPMPFSMSAANKSVANESVANQSVASMSVKEKNNLMRLPITTTSNDTSNYTITTSASSGTLLLYKHLMSYPRPAEVITYKKKVRRSGNDSIGKSATLVPITSAAFQQPQSQSPASGDGTFALIQNQSPGITRNITCVQRDLPTAISASDTSEVSPPSHYHPAVTEDTVLSLDDDKSPNNLSVIASTTSLATIQNYGQNIEPQNNKIDNLHEPGKSKEATREIESSVDGTKNSQPPNCPDARKIYLKCKPVHKLMPLSSTPNNQTRVTQRESGNTFDISPFDYLKTLMYVQGLTLLDEPDNNSLLERAKKVVQNPTNNDSNVDNTESLVTQASPAPSPPPEPNEVKPAATERRGEDVEKELDRTDKKTDEPSNVSPTASAECDRRYSSSTTGRNSDDEMAEHGTSTHKRSLRLSRLTETHTRLINCRICIKEFKYIYNLKKHMKTHRELVCKHKNILRYHCYVPLERLEGPLEVQDDTVKIEPSLTLGEGTNPDYFITYKKRFLEPNLPEVTTHRRKRSSYVEYFNESDEEKRSNTSNKKHKRLQILSDSEESTLTLPNDSQNKTTHLNIEDMDTVVDMEALHESTGLHDPCNILVERVPALTADDTTYISDNSSNDNTAAVKDKERKFKTKEKDMSLIEEVIQSAYRRFDSNSELNKVSSMKKNDIRKFLSIGRRVLTPNFRATGLIKYLEKNDLNINWINQNKTSTVAQNQSKSEAHFIRIGSKMEEFPSGNNLYAFTRHDPPTEPDAPTDAEKLLLLSYDEVQKRISQLSNNLNRTGNNGNDNNNSLQVPTAQHLLTILNRSQLPFPRSATLVDKPLSVNKQPVNIVSPLNKASGSLIKPAAGGKSSASNGPFAVNKCVANKSVANKTPTMVISPLDLSDDDDDDIGQPTFVMVNPASVKIKPLTKRTSLIRLPIQTTTSNDTSNNTTTTANGSSGTFILNKNPVSNPKPAGAITYKNKGRPSSNDSIGKSATLVPLGTPVFQQPPVRTSSASPIPASTSNKDKTSVSNQNQSPGNKQSITPSQTVAPTATSDSNPSKAPLPSYYHPAFTGDTVICLDDDETLDNMPVITSTTSLASVKDEEVSKPEQSKEATMETESTVNQETNSQPPNALSTYKTYIKCKPVHELMQSSSTPEGDNQLPVPSTAVTENENSNTVKPTNFLSIDGTVDRLTTPASNTKQNDTVNENGKPEKVMLDTVMLPNTITSSPFTYLRALMNLQRLTLLDKPDNFMGCLIKFKLGVHQPPISTMLCLYLLARPQVFCIKVTNGNTVAEVKGMSAAWQMEILKAFTDKSVTGKILDGATTKGTDLLASVKLFFSILNSIEMKIPNPS